MQAHLLLITSVYEKGVSEAFDNRDLLFDLKNTIQQLGDEELEEILLFDPEAKIKAEKLRGDSERLTNILEVIDSVPPSMTRAASTRLGWWGESKTMATKRDILFDDAIGLFSIVEDKRDIIHRR